MSNIDSLNLPRRLPSLQRVFYNQSENRLRSGWRLLLGSALGLLVIATVRTVARYILAVGLALTAQIPFSVLGDAQELSLRINSVYEQFPFLGAIHSLIILFLVGLAFWLMARWLDRRAWRDYGFHFNAAWWRDLGIGLLLGTVLMGAVFGLEYLLGWVSVPALLENGQPGLAFWPLLLNGLIAYVLVGVQEELFFRGFLLKNLAEGLPRSRLSAKAVVVLPYLFISILFGFAHLTNPNATLVSSLNLSLIGLLLGLGFVLTGELAIPIGLHIAWNFVQGCVLGFPVSGSDAHLSLLATQQAGPAVWTGGAFGPEGGLAGLAAALLGGLLIFAWVRWTRGTVSVPGDLARYSPPPAHATRA
jgi:membrane protease YdiL (CAAX protease family)